jgi:hypothetical protein
MEQKQIINPANSRLGATIFSVLTGMAFGCGVFLMLFSGIWQGLFFIFIAIGFACLCWVVLPKDHRLQLWVTGLTIALAMAFMLYLISNLTPRFM